MHIVHLICSDKFAGVERYVGTLAPLQSARGARVTVVGGAEAPMRALLGEAIAFIPAVTVRDAARALRAIAAGVDLVNTHMTAADAAGILGSRGRALPLVSTRHFAAPRGSNPLARRVLGALAGRFAAQISISAFVAGTIGEPSDVVLSGVADADGAPDRERHVLMAQRLEREKDTDSALRAWARTRARGDGWRLRIAGTGAERAALEAAAAQLGLADSVEFLGQRGDVGALMASSGIFLATAPAEPYGLSVAEAMAHALPVVAADGGGHRETAGLVADAALYPPGDVAAAAALIDELAADADRRTSYGRALQDAQRSRLGEQRWADQTVAVYERVLGR